MIEYFYKKYPGVLSVFLISSRHFAYLGSDWIRDQTIKTELTPTSLFSYVITYATLCWSIDMALFSALQCSNDNFFKFLFFAYCFIKSSHEPFDTVLLRLIFSRKKLNDCNLVEWFESRDVDTSLLRNSFSCSYPSLCL